MSNDLICLLAIVALFCFGWLIQYAARLHQQLDEANRRLRNYQKIIQAQATIINHLHGQVGSPMEKFINSLDFGRLEHK